MTHSFVGAYENFELFKAAAIKAGCPEDGSFNDYAEAHDYQAAKAFKTKDEAVAWVIEQINAGKTVFGCGDVIEISEVPREQRCRYCVCDGRQRIARTIVDDTGALDEEPCDSDCIVEL